MATPGGLVDKQELIDAQLDTAHLGRVVNSKDASGAPISTSTNRTGGVNKTLDALETEYLEAIRAAGGVSLGTWAAGITTFTKYNEYAVFNGIPYKPRTSATLPYVAQGADPTLAPDEANVQPYQEITEAQVVALVEATIPVELPKYTDIVYKSLAGSSAVENMITGVPIDASIGDICKAYGSEFQRKSKSTPSDQGDFSAIKTVTPEAWGAIGDGIADDTAALQASLDSGYAVELSKGAEYLHSGLTVECTVIANGSQLTYAGTGDGLSVGGKGYIYGAVIRPLLTGTSHQIKTIAQSDMKIIDCDVRYGQYNVYADSVVFGLSVSGCLIGDASADNIYGNQVKRSIIRDNYILASTGWGVNFDAATAASPDQMHGTVFEGNQIFGNESGGIRYVGKDNVDLAQHCVLVNNHIDHNYKDADITKPSYGVYIQNTNRALLNGNLIRAHTVMGLYMEDCIVPVVTSNQFWKSTVNPALSSIAITSINSNRGQFVGNGRDSGDMLVGLDDWTVVDRVEVIADELKARNNVYIDVFRMQFQNSGPNEGNLFVGHNKDIASRRCEWSNNNRTDFTFKVVGTVEATVGFTPFTGKHLFWSESTIDEGLSVDLIDVFEGVEQGLPQGVISVTETENSKICAGIVEHCEPMSSLDYINRDDGFLVMVAAVGDNNTDRLNGFRVNESNGPISAGDILVTSPVAGELMLATEGLSESVVRFKAMSTPKNGRCYGYFK